MKHEQHYPVNRQWGRAFLKALFVDSWFALGNVLLLIGGDDSVEIRFKSLAELTSLLCNNAEGHSA